MKELSKNIETNIKILGEKIDWSNKADIVNNSTRLIKPY